MTDFVKEQRYLVIKLKDAQKHLDQVDRDTLEDLLDKVSEGRAAHGKKVLQCVVVEEGWAIYNQVWGMIKTIEEQRTYDKTNQNGKLRCSRNQCCRLTCDSHFNHEGNFGLRVSDLICIGCPPTAFNEAEDNPAT